MCWRPRGSWDDWPKQQVLPLRYGSPDVSHPSGIRRSCGRHSKPRTAFLRHRARLYAALWLSAGIILASVHWIAPGLLIAATLLLTPLSAAGCAESPPHRPAALSLHLASAGLIAQRDRARSRPTDTTGLIADAGGATTIDGEVTRTTPIRLTQSICRSATPPGKNRVRVWTCVSFPRMAARLQAVCELLSTALAIKHSRRSTAGTKSIP